MTVLARVKNILTTVINTLAFLIVAGAVLYTFLERHLQEQALANNNMESTATFLNARKTPVAVLQELFGSQVNEGRVAMGKEPVIATDDKNVIPLNRLTSHRQLSMGGKMSGKMNGGKMGGKMSASGCIPLYPTPAPTMKKKKKGSGKMMGRLLAEEQELLLSSDLDASDSAHDEKEDDLFSLQRNLGMMKKKKGKKKKKKTSTPAPVRRFLHCLYKSSVDTHSLITLH